MCAVLSIAGCAGGKDSDKPTRTPVKVSAIAAQNHSPQADEARRVFADAVGKIAQRPDESQVHCGATAIRVFSCNARPPGVVGTRSFLGKVVDGIAVGVKLSAPAAAGASGAIPDGAVPDGAMPEGAPSEGR